MLRLIDISLKVKRFHLVKLVHIPISYRKDYLDKLLIYKSNTAVTV